MIRIILILTSLILIGCSQGEEQMATIGEEVGLEVVSTNVTDNAVAYDPDTSYPTNTEVLYNGSVYNVIDVSYGYSVYSPTTQYNDGDHVFFSDTTYETLMDIRYAPRIYNTFSFTPNGEVIIPSSAIHKRMWYNFASTPYYEFTWVATGTSWKKTYNFTYLSGTSYTLDTETYSYNFLSSTWELEGSSSTTVDVYEYVDGLAVGTYYIYDGALFIKDKVDSLPSISNTSVYKPLPLEHTLTYSRELNQVKPFDGTNITPATHDGSISDMQYVVRGTEEFNSFTLSKVLASSLTYTFTLPIGDAEYDLWLNGVPVANGGNGVVKTDTVVVDCSRDKNGILSDYPTTKFYSADRQMPINSTVTISLSYGSIIKLGDFTINNSVSDGLTNLQFGHAIQDYNEYSPDAWGNIPEGKKPVVTKFNITMDVDIDDYDSMVSFHESIVRNFVTVDGSDSSTAMAGSRVFNSLTRRVLITNVTSNTVVKDDELEAHGVITLSAREIV